MSPHGDSDFSFFLWHLDFDTRWLFFPQPKTGSLLNQPKAVLQKLAALSDLNPSAPRNSRNFVFHTLSPVKAETAKESSKPQVGHLRTESRIYLFVNLKNMYLRHKGLCCGVNLALLGKVQGDCYPQWVISFEICISICVCFFCR